MNVIQVRTNLILKEKHNRKYPNISEGDYVKIFEKGKGNYVSRKETRSQWSERKYKVILVGRDMMNNRYYKLDGMSKRYNRHEPAWTTFGWLVVVIFSSVFAFLFFLHLSYISLFGIFFFVFASSLLCFLLYTLSSSHDISPYVCSASSFLCFVFCSQDVVFLFLCIFQSSLFEYLASFRFFKVMLFCGIRKFYSSPTSNTSVETVLIIFNMSTFFLSSCFLFWHWYSSIRIILQFSTQNSSNDFFGGLHCVYR